MKFDKSIGFWIFPPLPFKCGLEILHVDFQKGGAPKAMLTRGHPCCRVTEEGQAAASLMRLG